MLAKALTHYFEAKLLLLDVTEFSLKVCLDSIFAFVHCSFLTLKLVFDMSSDWVFFCRFIANMVVPTMDQ